MGLKAVYSTGELARMAGIDRRRLIRMLDAAEVRYQYSGTRRQVPLVELQSRASGIIDSARIVQVLRKSERS